VHEGTEPASIVNHAVLAPSEARALLANADVGLLWDRARGVDVLPPDGLVVGAHLTFGADGRYILERAPEGGLGFYRSWSRRDKDRVRLDAPDVPIQRVLGVPIDGWPRPSFWPGATRGGGWDPLVVDLGDRVWVVRSAQVRVRDPMDPTGSALWGQVVFGSSFAKSQVLPDPEQPYRWVVQFGGPSRAEPRLVALPVGVSGDLDMSRDGVLLRSEPPPMIDPWGRDAPQGLAFSAIRVHLGDEASLEERLRQMPPPDPERYAQAGGPSDPLLVGVRGPRDPVGFGASLATFMLGEVTVLDLRGTSSADSVTPAWDGVDVAGWYGGLSFGAALRPDLAAGRIGWRVGRMRDIGFTAFELEVGSNLGSTSAPFVHSRIALNATVHASRLTRRSWLDLPLVLGTRVRAGTTGIEYDATAGLRAYAGRGWVVTPSAIAGFRHSARAQRAAVVVGIGVQGAFNGNVFRP
jgi:hypothetical protein